MVEKIPTKEDSVSTSPLTNTPAGAYLKLRYDYELSGLPELSELENALFEVAVDVMAEREAVEATVRALQHDLKLVEKSLGDASRFNRYEATYEPVKRSPIPGSISRLNESERRLGLFVKAVRSYAEGKVSA